MFAPVTKRARRVDSAEEIGVPCRKRPAAQAAPSGPVYLGIPTDLLAAQPRVAPAPLDVPARGAPPGPAELDRASSC